MVLKTRKAVLNVEADFVRTKDAYGQVAFGVTKNNGVSVTVFDMSCPACGYNFALRTEEYCKMASLEEPYNEVSITSDGRVTIQNPITCPFCKINYTVVGGNIMEIPGEKK